MTINNKAGHPINKNDLPDINVLITSYYKNKPNMNNPSEHVIFGTSGHRGTSILNSFTESHILAISQSICDYRKKNNINGPLFLGKDTHALSMPAEKTALQVFSKNNVKVMIDEKHGYTPTPVISHAILEYNRKVENKADGVIITPSHNPPIDGGIKYNPPHGGPADTTATNWIAKRANELLLNNNKEVKFYDYETALDSSYICKYDYKTPYVDDLENVIDMQCIHKSNLRICADAMGGSGLRYWKAIKEKYKLDIEIRNDQADPTFSFMSYDHDGKIRMDCSSPYAMAGLIDLKDKFDIAFGNDPDFDRHGIIAPSVGLLNPNHFLSVAIHYLFNNRPNWSKNLAIGKTLVSSSLIDRIADEINHSLMESPVGFKWFVNGLYNGDYGFGGEESAGASFLRMNGNVWSTDKDGIILALLACEICAKTKKDPGEYYKEITQQHGIPFYARIDASATLEQKRKLLEVSVDDIKVKVLGGEKIINKLTHAPANGEPINGIKILTKNGWFAARPSGTEELYKIYAESFISLDHLAMIQEEAKAIIANTIK
ncbi:MAG: phosphoglucomutase (alpha-D-glucose-1,6-bisphosphate-dependent) [Pontiellaceae bacterium]